MPGLIDHIDAIARKQARAVPYLAFEDHPMRTSVMFSKRRTEDF